MPDDLSDFDPWDVLLSEDELDEDEDEEVGESRSWEAGEWSGRARHPSARGLDVRPAVGTPMPAVVALLTGARPRRGGNRLPVGHPARGRAPRYRRCWQLPPDPERRDSNQRKRTRLAAEMALERGELPRLLYEALTTMLNLTDPECTPTYHSLRKIGKAAGGHDERTVCGWLAGLRRLGWVQRQHRWKVVAGGEVRGTSNLWRIDIPRHLREERYAMERQSRAESARAAAEIRKAQKPGKAKGNRYTQSARARHAAGVEPPDYRSREAERRAAAEAAAAGPVDPDAVTAGRRRFDEIRKRNPATRRARGKRAPPKT